MRLKGALGWSLALHAGVLALPMPSGFIAYVPTGQPLSVTWMGSPPAAPAPKPAAALLRTAASPSTRLPLKEAAPLGPPAASAASATVEEPRRAPPSPRLEKPAPAPRPSFRGRQAKKSDPTTPPVLSTPAAAPAADPGGSASIRMLSGSFLSLEHRQKVREHLKGCLTFPPVWIRGFVHMRLTLEPGGRLVTAQVLESSDAKLSEAALREVIQAAPYPASSRDVPPEALRYDFVIRYEPD